MGYQESLVRCIILLITSLQTGFIYLELRNLQEYPHLFFKDPFFVLARLFT